MIVGVAMVELSGFSVLVMAGQGEITMKEGEETYTPTNTPCINTPTSFIKFTPPCKCPHTQIYTHEHTHHACIHILMPTHTHIGITHTGAHTCTIHIHTKKERERNRKKRSGKLTQGRRMRERSGHGGARGE